MEIYLLVINIATFFLYGIDKRRAKRHLYRISEKTLITAAFLGGGIGACAGMKVFHHKTRKPLFKILVPFSAVIWCYIYKKYY